MTRAKPRKRRTKLEVERLKRQVYRLRERGLTYREIAEQVGLRSPQLVGHHLREFQEEARTELLARGAHELVLDALLRAQSDRQTALRELDSAANSRERLGWFWGVLKAGKRLDELLLELGLPQHVLSATASPAVREFLRLQSKEGPPRRGGGDKQ